MWITPHICIRAYWVNHGHNRLVDCFVSSCLSPLEVGVAPVKAMVWRGEESFYSAQVVKQDLVLDSRLTMTYLIILHLYAVYRFAGCASTLGRNGGSARGWRHVYL